MKAQTKLALAILLLSLCWMGFSGAASAASDTDLRHAALRKACTEQGGRFTLSWMYNDHGMKWGDVITCSMSSGNITCQGKLCRINYRHRHGSEAAATGGTNGSTGAKQFPAEIVEFYAALATLTER